MDTRCFFADKNRGSLPIVIISVIAISMLISLAQSQYHLQETLFLLYGLPILYISLSMSVRVGAGISTLAFVSQIIVRWDFFSAEIARGEWSGFLLKGVMGVGLYLAFCLIIASLVKKESMTANNYKSMADELAYTAKELKEANENITNLYLSTIQALAAAIDAKDPYTSGHSERVTKYALSISREMGLPKTDVQQIVYASILHDIGKIGVSEAILGKPGKLEPEEFEKIQKHTTIGANIISSIAMLDKVIPIVIHHHEYYNGKGYPFQKAADKIPVGARIIAVADAFDAMTSDRPYRKAMTKKEAVVEIRRCAGTQFDPNVVEAFLRTL